VQVSGEKLKQFGIKLGLVAGLLDALDNLLRADPQVKAQEAIKALGEVPLVTFG
jgi:hypothetical protein